ncbi:CocE/NonD family hydrolase [Mycobacterium sp. MS1601]|uniref:CocE/NonD family hydrolase n=1 Tax=Mycobacterium sp. MS1601 TaxID=1936029 RepID=UPI00178CA754|nr:CocE/NonD family hydrolase [Mycobacterium sp. MS1601]
MGASKYVGRVGGLAVALGVGIAIFVGSGAATADTEDSSPGTSTSESSSAQDDKASDTKQDNTSANKVDKAETDSGAEDTRATTKRSSYRTANTDRGAKDSQDTAADDDVAETSADEDDSANQDTLDSSPTPTGSAATTTPERQERGEPTDTATDPPLVAGAGRQADAAVPYTPSISLDDGVITGTNMAEPPKPLTYTLVRKPSGGGKVSLDTADGDFTFLPYLSPSRPAAQERFSVLVAEQTRFTQTVEAIPVVGALAPRIIVVLQQVPIVNDVLSPLIGRAHVYSVVVDVAPYVGEDAAPIAFTTEIRSFDGTRISVNFFPASGLEFGAEAPTLLNGPSLATAGYVNLQQASTVAGLVPGISRMRAAGYNVVTWDPRGEFASGGLMHLDSELFEARDVSAIIDWASSQPGVKNETAGDPLVGMVGGSYGGGIQLTSAGIDHRIDAIAPGIAWNSLNEALYPNRTFKSAWASLLALSLALTGSRPDPQIYAGIVTGLVAGFLTPGQQRFLSRNSPDTVVGDITAPTMFLQGTVDGLFVLQQALDNAAQLGQDVPVRMIWYCGGHGYCLNLDKQQSADQYGFLTAQTLAWMDTYVKNKGDEVPTPGPTFMWVDQKGDWFAADHLPLPGTGFFGSEVINQSGPGGLLPVVPFLGGSGPQTQAPFPLSLPSAAASRHALEVEIASQGTAQAPVHIVGAPTVTLTYSGVGTSRTIYAQLVDDKTGLVVGNLVTPIPVTLDGRQHTVEIKMENIAYTMADSRDVLRLQIVDSAVAYEDFTSFGIVNVSDVAISLPTAAQAVPTTLPHVPVPPATSSASSVEQLLTGASAR